MASRQRARLLQGRVACRTSICRASPTTFRRSTTCRWNSAAASPTKRCGGTRRWRSSATICATDSSRARIRSARSIADRRAALRSGRRRQGAGQRLRQLAGQLRDDPDRELFQDVRQPQRDSRFVAKAIDQEHLDARRRTKCACCCAPTATWARARTTTFRIFASDTIVSLWERLTATIAGMAVGIVSVFMVVGGIVIMNIMLAVVTERTHEIGIRKSLGARRRDILNQYLVESAVLAGTGGLVGVVHRVDAWRLLVRSLTSVPMALPWSSRVHRRRPFGDGRAVLRDLSGAAAPPSWIRSKRCGWRDNDDETGVQQRHRARAADHPHRTRCARF